MNLVYLGDQWDERQRRRQRLASLLGISGIFKRTLYVESPLSWLSRIRHAAGVADRDGRSRWERFVRRGKCFRQGSLAVLTPCTPLPYAWALHPWGAGRLSKEIGLYLPKEGESFLWVSHPLWKGCAEGIAAKFLVYDRSEDFSQFTGIGNRRREEIGAADRWLLERSDLVIVQTESHKEEITRWNPNVLCLPNGVDCDLFLPKGSVIPSNELREAARPVLGYVGSIGSRIDWKIVSGVAETYPRGTVVFVGEPGQVPRSIRHMRNILFLGERRHIELPQILAAFDVCILPYVPQAYYGSPTKLFEYLASGKPIVATDFSGMRDFGRLVLVAESCQDFVRKIGTALKEEALENRGLRAEAAKNASWERRGAIVVRILQEMLQQTIAKKRGRLSLV